LEAESWIVAAWFVSSWFVASWFVASWFVASWFVTSWIGSVTEKRVGLRRENLEKRFEDEQKRSDNAR
jgi:hypothetical protein